MLYVNVLTRTGTSLTKVSAGFKQELRVPATFVAKARNWEKVLKELKRRGGQRGESPLLTTSQA
jgi:hypothetical protein